LIEVSTLASNDAPASALSVLYNEHGAYEEMRQLPRSPEVVVVDTEIIASAPLRSLVAGFGDALTTYYEARVCYENPKARSMLSARPTRTAFALAKLSSEMLFDHAKGAVAAVRAKEPNESLEQVVEANTLLSGLGFESGGLAASHALAQALSCVPAVEDNHWHGEMVAIGLLTMLSLELNEGLPGRTEELEKVARFNCTVGLPATLAQVHFDINDTDALETVQRTMLRCWFCHNMAFEVTAERITAALKTVDAKGKAIVEELGSVAYEELHGIGYKAGA
jgi:glycerol dehydrogenase